MERRRSNSDYLIKREQQELEAGLSAADAERTSAISNWLTPTHRS